MINPQMWLKNNPSVPFIEILTVHEHTLEPVTFKSSKLDLTLVNNPHFDSQI